jgi:hypothetical protein
MFVGRAVCVPPCHRLAVGSVTRRGQGFTSVYEVYLSKLCARSVTVYAEFAGVRLRNTVGSDALRSLYPSAPSTYYSTPGSVSQLRINETEIWIYEDEQVALPPATLLEPGSG